MNCCLLRPILVQKAQKKGQEKRQRELTKAEELGIVPVRKVPRTLENTREQDVTTVVEGDEDVEVENEQDEFAEHFQNLRPPHVLLTTSFKATSVMYKFCADLMVCTSFTSPSQPMPPS
jgi:ribosome production factor 1